MLLKIIVDNILINFQPILHMLHVTLLYSLHSIHFVFVGACANLDNIIIESAC